MANVNFNPKNSQQVAHHLRGLIKTEAQLSYAIRELESVKRSAIGRFDGIVKFTDGYMIVPYFDQYATDEDKLTIFGVSVSIEKQIAFAMEDYDAPFSAHEVEAFCSFFGLDNRAMLIAAASEQQYEEWLNHELRASNY
jgi:hypothetical protein